MKRLQKAKIEILLKKSLTAQFAFAVLDKNPHKWTPSKVATYFDRANLTQHAQALRLLAQEKIS